MIYRCAFFSNYVTISIHLTALWHSASMMTKSCFRKKQGDCEQLSAASRGLRTRRLVTETLIQLQCLPQWTLSSYQLSFDRVHINHHQPSLATITINHPQTSSTINHPHHGLVMSCAKLPHLPRHSPAAWFPSQPPVLAADAAADSPRPSQTSWAAKPSAGLEGSQRSSAARRTTAGTWKVKIRLDTKLKKNILGGNYIGQDLCSIISISYIDPSTGTLSSKESPAPTQIAATGSSHAAESTSWSSLASSLRVHETTKQEQKHMSYRLLKEIYSNLHSSSISIPG